MNTVLSMTSLLKAANQLQAEYDLVTQQVKEETAALAVAEDSIDAAAEGQILVQQIAQQIQQQTHQRIASVVTRCLKAIFREDAYEFRIQFKRSRGKTDARLQFLTPNGNEIDPTDGSGGGLLDVASLSLRLAALLLQRPQSRKLIVMDEPLKNLNGAVYQRRVGKLIESLAEEFGVQFLIVTDDSWLKIGKVVSL